MPGFDGTGPLGQGPMTGQGRGFCVLTSSEENPDQVQGFVGIDSKPIDKVKMIESFKLPGKEVIKMPRGDGTGPAGMGPMTGRAAGFCAGYPIPGYMNPVAGRTGFYGAGVPAFGAYGAGYGMPYGGWGRRGFGFGFGRGFGRGRGRGRGRFGYW
jgi:hypothetical protein